ncbi:DUF4089 domain-containing protein [Lichenifustis flavocetrariae]|uniref:DUF4089 domain-containing protein n=1 Tax=Lichenifustis flavocetrariae TaxID=2949735 RepID=A0AA41YXZ1_9HYPH|nr:DUF4089 domain-containing protein [Lichenifustis flavocetrariae]MCW6509088.1 DUF4089 domain-containing protein [Lichenifustis flavocetrariae]
MTEKREFDPEAIVDAMAPLLGLDIRPEYRPGVVTNLKVTAALAALFLDPPLDDHAEPAAVFHP